MRYEKDLTNTQIEILSQAIIDSMPRHGERGLLNSYIMVVFTETGVQFVSNLEMEEVKDALGSCKEKMNLDELENVGRYKPPSRN